MNREILFRGKLKDNGEWVYGDLIQIPCGLKLFAQTEDYCCELETISNIYDNPV